MDGTSDKGQRQAAGKGKECVSRTSAGGTGSPQKKEKKPPLQPEPRKSGRRQRRMRICNLKGEMSPYPEPVKRGTSRRQNEENNPYLEPEPMGSSRGWEGDLQKRKDLEKEHSKTKKQPKN